MWILHKDVVNCTGSLNRMFSIESWIVENSLLLFSQVESLVSDLAKQLMTIIDRTIQASQNNSTELVTALRIIIMREERSDNRYKEEYQERWAFSFCCEGQLGPTNNKSIVGQFVCNQIFRSVWLSSVILPLARFLIQVYYYGKGKGMIFFWLSHCYNFWFQMFRCALSKRKRQASCPRADRNLGRSCV